MLRAIVTNLLAREGLAVETPGGVSWTYHDLGRLVAGIAGRVAAAQERLGLARTTVALAAPRGIAWVAADLALLLRGDLRLTAGVRGAVSSAADLVLITPDLQGSPRVARIPREKRVTIDLDELTRNPPGHGDLWHWLTHFPWEGTEVRHRGGRTVRLAELSRAVDEARAELGVQAARRVLTVGDVDEEVALVRGVYLPLTVGGTVLLPARGESATQDVAAALARASQPSHVVAPGAVARAQA